MSWSVNYIGTPEKISEELEKNSSNLSGVSKQEYDDALPHLKALVNLNVNKDYPIALKLDASGHGYDGNCQCQVSISNIGRILN